MSDDPSAREEGFYWVELGQNPPEIAYRGDGEWWLPGDPKTWHPEAAGVGRRPAGVLPATGAGGVMLRRPTTSRRDEIGELRRYGPAHPERPRP